MLGIMKNGPKFATSLERQRLEDKQMEGANFEELSCHAHIEKDATNQPKNEVMRRSGGDSSEVDDQKSKKVKLFSVEIQTTEEYEREVARAIRKRKLDEAQSGAALLKQDRNYDLEQNSENPIISMSSEGKKAISGINYNVDATIARKKTAEMLRMFRIIHHNVLLQKQQSNLKFKRPDLIALKLYKERISAADDGQKYLGSIPGVEIGDEYHLRVELYVIRLHCQHLVCVDYMKQGERNIAVSIVSYGRYANGMGNADVFLYSGSGKEGNEQKPEGGDLALKNSMDAKAPVRVIRGIKRYQQKDKVITTYRYDGLYLVDKFWTEIGDGGRSIVFMFQLVRREGQPSVRRNSLPFVEDISQGTEGIPIPVKNYVDNENPMPFNYTPKMVYPSRCSLTQSRGCNCTRGCSDSKRCACAVKNGGKIPFNQNGAIMRAKPVIYECGPSCKCPPTCRNRASQHGIKIQLEIFKTESRGWGVRSPNSILSGSFICEYAGELLSEEEAQKRTNDEYLFGIGNNFDDQLWKDSSDQVQEESFTIDASSFGNVGRFINHSCSPNLYAQNLLYEHENRKACHIMLFASENIPPLQELTYNYNYKIDQVYDSVGNIKKKKCNCGSVQCKGWLY